jgi:hypothetical protein
MERVTGLEPVSHPWQGRVIPLYDTRRLDMLTIQIYPFDDFLF